MNLTIRFVVDDPDYIDHLWNAGFVHGCYFSCVLFFLRQCVWRQLFERNYFPWFVDLCAMNQMKTISIIMTQDVLNARAIRWLAGWMGVYSISSRTVTVWMFAQLKDILRLWLSLFELMPIYRAFSSAFEARLGSQEKKSVFKLCLSLMSFVCTIHKDWYTERLIAVKLNKCSNLWKNDIIDQNNVKLRNI